MANATDVIVPGAMFVLNHMVRGTSSTSLGSKTFYPKTIITVISCEFIPTNTNVGSGVDVMMAALICYDSSLSYDRSPRAKLGGVKNSSRAGIIVVFMHDFMHFRVCWSPIEAYGQPTE